MQPLLDVSTSTYSSERGREYKMETYIYKDKQKIKHIEEEGRKARKLAHKVKE